MKRIIVIMIACMLLSGCDGSSCARASNEEVIPADIISQGVIGNTYNRYLVFKPEGTNRICIMTYRKGYSDTAQTECWKEDNREGISNYE